MPVPRPIRRTSATLAALAVSGAASLLAISAASAGSTGTQPAGGTVHIYLVNTSLNPAARAQVLITGAFSDHGSGKGGTWTLTRGTITLDASKLKAIANSPTFGTSYPASCSFAGVAKGPITILGGTGAYKGISGSMVATETVAGEGSLLKNGQCNQANNAPAVAQFLMVTGSGTVSFK